MNGYCRVFLCGRVIGMPNVSWDGGTPKVKMSVASGGRDAPAFHEVHVEDAELCKGIAEHLAPNTPMIVEGHLRYAQGGRAEILATSLIRLNVMQEADAEAAAGQPDADAMRQGDVWDGDPELKPADGPPAEETIPFYPDSMVPVDPEADDSVWPD